MRTGSFFLFLVLITAGATAQVSTPLQAFSSGGARGASHPSTATPTHISSVGQPVVMPRPAKSSNGAGVMNAAEFMFTTQRIWHVSVDGNDENDGTALQPFRNIQTALSAASAGDVIKVAGGIFEEGLIPQSKVALFGGYANSFDEADRDPIANRTTVRAVSAVILNDDHGCTIDGFFFDGNNTAETGLDISSSSIVTHNIIVRCTQGVDYGLNVSGDAVVRNNVIHGNIRGVLLFGGNSAGAVFKNNIVTGNSNAGLNNSSASGIHSYNDVQGNGSNYLGNFNSPGIGDISLNPMYVDAAGDDFRLQPGSPAIDRGDPADPVGDEPPNNGGRINLGAYGGTKNATPTNPIVESFNPEAGPVSTPVTINGLNFSSTPANNIVKFNGVPAIVSASNSTTITTTVPPGATGGVITVEVNGGIGTSASNFTVIHPPAITSVDPGQGQISTLVTISGSGFSPTPAENIVFFGAIRAQVTSALENSLTVIVPPGATYQNISVTVNGLTGYSKSLFLPLSFHEGEITGEFFEPIVTMTSIHAAFSPIVIDLDGDGKPDVITANSDAKNIALLKNNHATGNLTSTSFGTPIVFSVAGNPRTVESSDLNGDGKPDIVVGDFDGSTLSIFQNIAAPGVINEGTLSKMEMTTDPSVNNVAIADLDMDGKPEIVFSSGWPSQKVTLLRNQSSVGTFTIDDFPKALDLLPGNHVTDLEIHDMDQDGKPDLVINSGSDIYIFRNNSIPGSLDETSFLPEVHFFNNTCTDFSIGDVNNDGLPDLVGVAYNDIVLVFENNISGGIIEATSFANMQTYSTGEDADKCALADFNGDGKTDIVVVNYNDPTISVFQNDGDIGAAISPSTFLSQQTFAVSQHSYGVTTGDMDLDGAVDIVLTKGGFVDILRSAFTPADPAPIIEDFTPNSGPVGTEVTIDGQNFGASPVVKFNGVIASIVSSTDIQIITEVPVNAADGFITVESDGKIGVSSEAFDVTPSAPVIDNFAPTEGPVGTQVTITGQHLLGSTVVVKFNTVAANVISNDGNAIVAEVPTGATDGPITVDVDGLVATSAGNFTVTVPPDPPVIDSFDPTEGPVGTEVTISGQHLAGSNLTVKFNSVAAVITSGDDNTIVTIVPAGASDGPITIDVNGYSISTSSNFTVTSPQVPPPVIGSFTPDEGPVGTEVTINGQNFGIDPIVKFNNVDATLQSNTETQIVTTVPAGATTGIITVKAGALTGASATNFTVIPQPVVLGFTPGRAPVGGSVTITGQNFDPTAGNNTVGFNGAEVTSITSASAGSLTVEVPVGATSGKIAVTVNSLTGTSSGDFVVTPTTVDTNYGTMYDKGATLTVSLTVDNAQNVKSAALKIKGISESASAWESITTTPVGNVVEVTLSGDQLDDPIGVQYFFELTDHGDNVIPGSVTNAFLNYPAASAELAFPNLSFGNKVENYQIIAVPLQLDNPNVTSVFSSLGEYNIKQWRLFDYSSGTREYPAFNTIVPGKGYWLIVRNSATINPGSGGAVTVSDNDAFQINLVSGWNLIGNPFNFSISWQDVMDFNNNPAGVEPLKGFSGGALSDIDVLQRYRGGFVFADAPFALQIPALRNTSLGGRIRESIDEKNPLDADDWTVRLVLEANGLSNHLGGIGMRRDALLEGKDRYDGVSLPLPEGLDLFELRFSHPELHASFNRDIVPAAGEFTWTFDLARSSNYGDIYIRWENKHFGDNDKQLVLYDPSTLETVDMREYDSYRVSGRSKKLQILFGSSKYIQESLEGQLPWLGRPYPNPAVDQLTIPFRVPEGLDPIPVTISIYNSKGVEVAKPVDGVLPAGTHEVRWKPDNASGLFLIRARMGREEVKTIKVIFQ